MDEIRGGDLSRRRETLVGLTFDDGPLFDYTDFDHPVHGPQRSFLNLMQDFSARHGRGAQPQMHATSFVIASPVARRSMETSPDCGYPHLNDWLGDSWWGAAAATGLMEIGNHSWDHVHHAVGELVTTSNERDNFATVNNYQDADREIRAAAEYINRKIRRSRCRMFAYPFGHATSYLANDYLPRHVDEHGMIAAFGTGGRAVCEGDSVWNIPRAVCGWHWNEPEQLAAMLRQA